MGVWVRLYGGLTSPVRTIRLRYSYGGQDDFPFTGVEGKQETRLRQRLRRGKQERSSFAKGYGGQEGKTK